MAKSENKFITNRYWETEVGYEAVIVTNSLGALCGYVRVPESHPWFGVHYSDQVPGPIPEEALERDVSEVGFMGMVAVMSGGAAGWLREVDGRVLGTHGGLTFSGERPSAEVTEGWWFGFDCGHAGDHVPGLAELGASDPTDHVWTVPEVAERCEFMARQLHGYANWDFTSDWAIRDAFLAGFKASFEGWNGEYATDASDSASSVAGTDNLREAYAEFFRARYGRDPEGLSTPKLLEDDGES